MFSSTFRRGKWKKKRVVQIKQEKHAKSLLLRTLDNYQICRVDQLYLFFICLKKLRICTFFNFQIFLLSVDSFSFKCPLQSSWKHRAYVTCNRTLEYFCLYNSVIGEYVEGCNGPDWDRKGKVICSNHPHKLFNPRKKTCQYCMRWKDFF